MRPFRRSVSLVVVALVVLAIVLSAIPAQSAGKSPQQQTFIGAGKPKVAELDLCCSDTKNTADVVLVSAKGVWRPDNPTKKNELVEAVTELSCFRHGGKDLAGTEAFCLQATANASSEMLDVGTQWLKVIEWSDTQVIAITDSRLSCATSQTIFDLKRKTVIALDVRKPDVRGLFDECKELPDRQTYYLQDVADYYFQKLHTNAK